MHNVCLNDNNLVILYTALVLNCSDLDCSQHLNNQADYHNLLNFSQYTTF